MHVSSRLLTPSAVNATLRSHNIRPDKSLGQHFLLDLDVVEASIAAAAVTSSDTVIEVGSGIGVLTEALAQRCGRLIAVELDRDMLRVLAGLRKRFPNVELVEGNIVKLPLHELVGDGPYKVVANLPYYITSAAIRYFLEAINQPSVMALLMQREVAQRVCARPNDMSLLALSVQLYAEPVRVMDVPPSSFYPEPQVTSSVVRLTRRAAPFIAPDSIPLFFRLATAGFADRRKQLHNALRMNLRLTSDVVETLLERAGIDGARRAETLSLEEWRTFTAIAGDVVRLPGHTA
jgi:16S rRNA (adenine1518-N6/adenine1519-N6)-dimethyltransferase